MADVLHDLLERVAGGHQDFYSPEVREHDSLFRDVAREILKKEPTRESRAELLTELQRASVYLIDRKLDPADFASEHDLR